MTQDNTSALILLILAVLTFVATQLWARRAESRGIVSAEREYVQVLSARLKITEDRLMVAETDRALLRQQMDVLRGENLYLMRKVIRLENGNPAKLDEPG